MIIIIIQKSRINNCNRFSTVTPGTPIRIKVDDVGRFKEKLKAFGFKENDENGTSILPNIVNCYAKKNAEQFFTIDRDLPLEEYTQTVYWTRYEWAGKGQTNPVTGFSFIPKQRFHRNYFAPFSVCFTLVTSGEKSYIVSDDIIFSEKDQGKLLNTINILLNYFGECTVDVGQQESDTKRVIVNWDILPKGEYPWSVVKETLDSLIKGHTKTCTAMMLRNCEAIYAKHPDFVAYGRSGFKGYAILGFKNKNLYILESVMPNNATYVLENDWKKISQLSKAEILSQDLHKARIIHSANWQINFDKIMEENNG